MRIRSFLLIPFSKSWCTITLLNGTRNQYVTLEYQHAHSASLLNTARLGFNRSVQEADNRRTGSIAPSLSFVRGELFGFFTINGVVSEAGGERF